MAELTPLFVIDVFALDDATTHDLFQSLFYKNHIARLNLVGKLPGCQHLVLVGAGTAVQLTHFGPHFLF